MTTRRDFIKKTVAGTAALSLGSILPGFGSNRYQDILGANEKIRIGVIGVNSRGNALAQGFAKQPDCEVTYICDVDSRALEKCQAAIRKLTGRTPKGEKDIRKMLESNEFEAVVIATPDHWHAKAAIMAMQAGKHVYLEKPTSHNPAENEMLVRATLKYNRVVQVGNQRRSFPNVIKAMEEIKSGTKKQDNEYPISLILFRQQKDRAYFPFSPHGNYKIPLIVLEFPTYKYAVPNPERLY